MQLFRRATSVLALCLSIACVPDGRIVAQDTEAEYTVKLSLDGLWTNPNQLSGNMPAGALARADNITIDRPGVGTPVRGMERQSYGTPDGLPIRSFFSYAGGQYVTTDLSIYRDTGSAYASTTDGLLADGPPPGALGHRVATAGSYLFVAVKGGVLMRDGANGAFNWPGAPQALEFRPFNATTDLSAPGSTGAWLPAGASAAYRYVIGYNDTAGRPVLGAPSGRMVITNNTAGAVFVSLYPELPQGVTTANFIQLYRTASVPAGADPGDSMAQVGEMRLTALHVSTRQALITDKAPDAMRGVPLYTNATLGGIARQSNLPPPMGADLAVFRDCLFVANTTAPQRAELRLLAVPSDGDVISVSTPNGIGGFTIQSFTAKVGTPGAGQFAVETSGTVSQNIERTARNLVDLINRQSSINGYPYVTRYTSADGDPPGIVVFEGKAAGRDAFTVATSANAERYEPQLAPPASSAADVRKNRLHFSKQGLPYAFPITNTLAIGAEDIEIVRIIALRESLLVFKAKDPNDAGGGGLWKVTGSGPGAFYVQQMHKKLNLIAPESLAVVDNAVYGLSDAGVVEVSEAGVEFIDLPIANIIRDRIVRLPLSLRARAFGVGNEQELKFSLYLPNTTEADEADGTLGYVSEAYVWNAGTQTWTRRIDTEVVSGAVGADDKLRLGLYGTARAKVERRTGTPADYMGPLKDQPVVINEYDDAQGRTVLELDGSFDVQVGDLVRASGDTYATVLAIDTSGNYGWTLTLSRHIAVDLVGGPTAVDTFEPIKIGLAWTVNDGSNPTTSKQFTESTLLFEQPQTGAWGWWFKNDSDPTPAFVEGESEGMTFCRVGIPNDVQRTTRLYTEIERNVARERLDILGLDATFRGYGGPMQMNTRLGR